MATEHDSERAVAPGTNEAAGPSREEVRPSAVQGRVLATGPNATSLAALIASAPQLAAQFMTAIASHFGNSTVQQTLAVQKQPGIGVGKITASQLNVRSTPAKADDNVIGQLDRGTPVTPLAKRGPWLEIPHGQQPGFVWSQWVEFDGSTPTPDPSAHAETQTPTQAAAAPAPVAPVAKPLPQAPPAQVINQPAATTQTVTPHAVIHPGAETFETIQHTQVEIHQKGEGKILSDIRAFKQQFDPHWLIQLQQKLQVGDATGAFNTETLRAMRDVTGEHLDAKKITNETFLVALGARLGVEGEPFRAEVDALGHDERDLTKTDPADLAAQSIGYADYDTYYATALTPVKFLGVSLVQGSSDGQAHPLLASRIAAAEAYLIQRFGSAEKAITGTGWSKRAGAAYATSNAAHDTKDPKSHMHTMGMAMDIDPGVNPYTMPKGDGPAADWITWFYQTGFELGHRLGYGGDALNLDSLLEEGQQMSSEELHEHMLASSQSFARTVELSEQSDDDIKAALLAAREPYTDGPGDKGIPSLMEKWFHPAKKMFHDAKSGERKFHETMTESKELIVALRDAAGLNWGGTEMSAGQNGDFMHFDTRNDSIGHTVYKAGYDAQQDRKAKQAKEAKEAKEAKHGKKIK